MHRGTAKAPCLKRSLGIPREMMSKPLLLSGLVATAAGHAAATHPKPRQAIDGSIHPWNGTVPDPIPFTNPANWCASPDKDSTDPRKITGSNGQ